MAEQKRTRNPTTGAQVETDRAAEIAATGATDATGGTEPKIEAESTDSTTVGAVAASALLEDATLPATTAAPAYDGDPVAPAAPPIRRSASTRRIYADNLRGGLRQLIDTGEPTQDERGALEHILSGISDVRAYADRHGRSATTPAVVEFLDKLDKLL